MIRACLKICLSVVFLLLSMKALAQGIPPDLASSVNGFGEESPAAASFLEKSTRKGAPRDFTEKVLNEAKALRDRGLPAEPYLLKASEGLAKGAPPERIGGALQKTRRQTEEAESFVNRTLQRKGLSSTPEEKRGAISNFQKALFLNQTPPRRLEKWIDAEEGPGKSKHSLDQLGKGARELEKPLRGKEASVQENRTEPRFEKPRTPRESEKKMDDKKREEKPKSRSWKSDQEPQGDSRGKEKGSSFFKMPGESSSGRSSPSSPSSPSQGHGHGKNK